MKLGITNKTIAINSKILLNIVSEKINNPKFIITAKKMHKLYSKLFFLNFLIVKLS